MNPQPSSSNLYAAYVFNGNEKALQFWGPIPRNIKEAISLSTPLVDKYSKKQPLFSKERLHILGQTIRSVHQKFNMLTPMVKENLVKLEEREGVIEAGHQPALLAGPGFIINKIAAITKTASFQQTTPVMFVGDHDHEQNELTVIHLPSPGPRGLTFSLPISREYKMSPMHVIPLPSKDWLKGVISKITSTYHELIAGSAKERLATYEKRINLIRDLLKSTYDHAHTVSEWTMGLWMRIVNMMQDSGVLFQNFSNPIIRELMLPAFEYLLATPNRQRLIRAINESATRLEHLGYEPGIGRRADTYVPFHIECPTGGCNRTRLDPELTLNYSETYVTITAKCPKCKITHTIEVKATAPDLAEWKTYLSPRVDTRAFLVQSYTPVIIHIGGAGETSYHAQVSPALHANNSIVPIFFRYTRLYYENPWTNRTAQGLAHEGLLPLNYNELQCFELAINTAYTEENTGVIQSLFAASQEHISDTLEELIDQESQLEKERSETISRQREIMDPVRKQESQAKIGLLTRRRQILQTYLSQMFGRYSAERVGQEVSFIWIDGAMSMNPEHYFTRLLSHYREFTPSSATFFLADESALH
jgi:uncharacterized protein YllA (UPF0747 family)